MELNVTTSGAEKPPAGAALQTSAANETDLGRCASALYAIKAIKSRARVRLCSLDSTSLQNPPQSPTIVHFLPHIEAVDRIESVNMTSHCVFEVVLHWQDDRIIVYDEEQDLYVFDSEVFGEYDPCLIDSWDECKVWYPKLRMMYTVEQNVDPVWMNIEVLRYDGKPHVMMYIGCSYECKHIMDFKWFPFDTQGLTYCFMLQDQPALAHAILIPHDLTHMVDASACFGYRVESGTDGYRILAARLVPSLVEIGWARTLTKFGVLTEGDKLLEMEGGIVLMFSVFEVRVLIQRHWSFFFWKIIVIVYGLIAMAPMTFYFDKEAIGDKTAVTCTLVLTAVAFQSATTDYIPVLPYMTGLDNLMNLMYLLMAYSFFQNCAVFLMVRRNYDDSKATGLDSNSMIAYVVVTGLSIIYVLYTFVKGKSSPEKYTHWLRETLNFVPSYLKERLNESDVAKLEKMPQYTTLYPSERSKDYQERMRPTMELMERKFQALRPRETVHKRVSGAASAGQCGSYKSQRSLATE